MEEILAQLEACMARLDGVATAQNGDSRATLAPDRSGVYVSMVTVDGKPILPPLMTPDKKAEMAHYKEEAMIRERKRAERKERALIAKVEQIVNSYEESRKSVGSKETSPVVVANKSPERISQVPGQAREDSKSASSEVTTNGRAYSPLKYMEPNDMEEEWNVRPATPWRRAKQSSKPRKQIAANFGSAAPSQPISSTMRMDASVQDLLRGNTPDVSAISLASSRAVSSLSNISPVVQAKPATPPSVSPIQKETFQTDSVTPKLADSGHGEVHSAVPVSPNKLERISPGANSEDVERNTHNPTSLDSSGGFDAGSAQLDENETSISRLSPIPREDAVSSEREGVLASLGSQSTSSSSNSALNQTVIDLSQLSLAKSAEGQRSNSPETSPSEGPYEETQKQVTLAAASPAKTDELQDDHEHKATDVVNSAQYLSDTESYLSLLGEYSQLPAYASRRQDGASNPNGEGKKASFFSDPTLPRGVDVQVELEASGTHEEGSDGQKKVMDTVSRLHDVNASSDGQNKLDDVNAPYDGRTKAEDFTASERSVDTMSSEYFGSSLGTLAQSCTLPLSLSSMTSESTLQGVEDMWENRTSQNVTPTGIEGGASPLGEEPKGVGMEPTDKPKSAVFATSEGQKGVEIAAASVIPDKPNPSKRGQSAEQMPGSKSEPEGDRRSGVKVESMFPSTPRGQHVRRSSYTLDFPSPALLDAESRNQAPHIASVDIISNADGSIPNGQELETSTHNVSIPGVTDAKVSQEAQTSASNVADVQKSEDLSSDLKDLKLDDVTESKVLHIQLSCLERMQDRLQRGHEDQMKELMHQQMQELSLLETEMDGIRRQAAESALGHVEGGEIDKTTHESSVDNQMASKHLENETKENAAISQKLSASHDWTNPPSSPGGGRKRRYDGTTTGDSLLEVPPSYISPSTLSGSGHSPIHSDAAKKLTAQDSLDSNHSNGLVEVPPSYIAQGSGGYQRQMQRSPQRTHSPANSARRSVTPGGPSASPSVLVSATNAAMSRHVSGHLSASSRTISPVVSTHLNANTGRSSTSPASFSATPDATKPDRDSSRLSTWLAHQANSATEDLTGPKDGTGVDSSFFLSESHGEDSEASYQVPEVQPGSPNVRPWTITPTLQADSRFDKMSARVKGYLTRALLRTPKVTAVVKTIKDTQQFLIQFQAETPVKRGKLSNPDTKLAHRVLAQLRAAQYELDDIFHNYPIYQRLAILHAAREQERDNYFNKKVSPPSVGDKAKPLSAATRKAMERRQQLAKDLDLLHNGPKRQKLAPQNQRPKSAAELRVPRPLQSAKSPGRPASALPPKTSNLHYNQHSHNLKKADALRKPFPTKPVIVSRNATTKAAKSPSRPTSRPVSRVTSTRPSTAPALHSQARKIASGQPLRSSGQHVRSPSRQQSSAQSQTHKTVKSVRRSLYPATTSSTGRKTTTMVRKHVEARKP